MLPTLSHGTVHVNPSRNGMLYQRVLIHVQLWPLHKVFLYLYHSETPLAGPAHSDDLYRTILLQLLYTAAASNLAELVVKFTTGGTSVYT